MEEIQCVFCSRSSDQIAVEENGYLGRKCPSCGLIYISPRPSPSEIQNLYRQGESNVSAESPMTWGIGKRLHARHNLAIIKKFIRNGSMLEIGPGEGYFLHEARKEGFDAYGIEINNIQADFIRRDLGIPCEESPLDIHSFGGKKFDIIYHCDVISHLYDPITEFRNIKDALSDNGLLAFETGNGGDVEQEYFRHFASFEYPGHLFFFGENNLKELLRLTGFEFMQMRRYSVLPQLLIIRVFRRAIDSFKSHERRGSIGKGNMNGSSSANVTRFSTRLIREAYDLFSYLIRYKMGYIMPKKGRPQTVIVIARMRK